MTIHLVAILLIFSQITSPHPTQILAPVPGQIVNIYRAPATEYSAGHRGIDLETSIDQPVIAPEDSTVSFVGKVGFRNLITLEFQDKKLTMEPVCSTVSQGTSVAKGLVIGVVCEADPDYAWHCPACLHLGIRNSNGYLSPELFLGGLSASRLLP